MAHIQRVTLLNLAIQELAHGEANNPFLGAHNASDTVSTLTARDDDKLVMLLVS